MTDSATWQDKVREDAARWYLRMSASVVDQNEAEDFQRWLTASASHQSAYDHTQQSMAAFDAISGTEAIVAFAEQARERVSGKRQIWRPVLATAASILLCFGLAITLDMAGSSASHEQFSSAVGHRRELVLQDGSRLSLDAGTNVSATFSKDARRLELETGLARFTVAHDTTRPFSVTVAGQEVVATGTDFTIEKLTTQTVVTLLQGRVVIYPSRKAGLLDFNGHDRSSDRRGVHMRPGDRLSFDRTGIAKLTRVDPGVAVSWQSGMLTFNDDELDTAVERFNRFNRQKLVLDQSVVGRLRVSGMFPEADPAKFAHAVAQLYSLHVREDDDGSLHLTNSHPSK